MHNVCVHAASAWSLIGMEISFAAKIYFSSQKNIFTTTCSTTVSVSYLCQHCLHEEGGSLELLLLSKSSPGWVSSVITYVCPDAVPSVPTAGPRGWIATACGGPIATATLVRHCWLLGGKNPLAFLFNEGTIIVRYRGKNSLVFSWKNDAEQFLALGRISNAENVGFEKIPCVLSWNLKQKQASIPPFFTWLCAPKLRVYFVCKHVS